MYCKSNTQKTCVLIALNVNIINHFDILVLFRLRVGWARYEDVSRNGVHAVLGARSATSNGDGVSHS